MYSIMGPIQALLFDSVDVGQAEGLSPCQTLSSALDWETRVQKEVVIRAPAPPHFVQI